jgi:hypothetical protein
MRIGRDKYGPYKTLNLILSTPQFTFRAIVDRIAGL